MEAIASVNDALSAYLDFPLHPAVIMQILDAHSDLAGDAKIYGWSDTEVGERLITVVSVTLIGEQWPTYAQARTNHVSI